MRESMQSLNHWIPAFAGMTNWIANPYARPASNRFCTRSERFDPMSFI
jgi:hypothetical protein